MEARFYASKNVNCPGIVGKNGELAFFSERFVLLSDSPLTKRPALFGDFGGGRTDVTMLQQPHTRGAIDSATTKATSFCYFIVFMSLNWCGLEYKFQRRFQEHGSCILSSKDLCAVV